MKATIIWHIPEDIAIRGIAPVKGTGGKLLRVHPAVGGGNLFNVCATVGTVELTDDDGNEHELPIYVGVSMYWDGETPHIVAQPDEAYTVFATTQMARTIPANVAANAVAELLRRFDNTHAPAAWHLSTPFVEEDGDED